jgi:hypothetical protein
MGRPATAAAGFGPVGRADGLREPLHPIEPEQLPLRSPGDLDGDSGRDQAVKQADRGLHRDVQRGGERGGGDERRRRQEVDRRKAASPSRSNRADRIRSRTAVIAHERNSSLANVAFVVTKPARQWVGDNHRREIRA